MLPGPIYVYECPICGNLLKKGSLMSGNTFGAQIFSDGKTIAPMLPEFPNLTKCKRCDAIFWLNKLNEIGAYKEWSYNVNPDWRNADDACFLEINDYMRALDSGAAITKQEELYIRQRIWWGYNDRIRNGEEIFDDSEDELRWRDNLNKLLLLLDQTDLNQKIMIAEIKRNLGEFETCIDIITKIDNEELNWLKEKFIKECEQKNRWVIQLN